MDWTTPGEVWLACAVVAFCAVPVTLLAVPVVFCVRLPLICVAVMVIGSLPAAA